MVRRVHTTATLHNSWVDISSILPANSRCFPSGGRIIDDESETIGIVGISPDLDADMRGVMPEEEPANDSKDHVETTECISFILNDIDDALFIFIFMGYTIVNQLLCDDLKVLRWIPNSCDSAEDFFFEPVVKNYDADESNARFKQRRHLE